MFEVGQIYHRRTDIHDRFGGNRQSGIASCAGQPLIFLFSSPRGEEFGYRDGWASASEYRYTGEGQVGDMEMTRGNRAIRDHQDEGRDLLLFEKRSTGYYEYLGKFECLSFEYRRGDDAQGNERTMIVFRLASSDRKGGIEQ